jgi:DNA processing protein
MTLLPDDQIKAWLRLLGSGLDRSILSRLAAAFGGPREILESSDATLAADFGLAERQLSQLRRQPSAKSIDAQFAALEKHGVELIPVGDARFPRNLFAMRVPPPVIFTRGTVEDFDALSAGIVGPRAATNYGISVARAFARDFAPTMTVISGAALGIDSAAHEAVLDAGGRTVAVLGCGLDVNYPAGNERLRERIAREGGALLTAYAPGTQPLRAHFPARNEILAGLSLAVIVVEAGARSGALVTARAAGEEGRPVYAVPGDITRRNSIGSNGLLRDGAIACTSAADVIADMEAMLAGELESLRARRAATKAADAPATNNTAPLAPAETVLLDTIQHSTISHDDLLARFVPDRLTVGELSTALLMLELKGRIQQLPGRVYAPKL